MHARLSRFLPLIPVAMACSGDAPSAALDAGTGDAPAPVDASVVHAIIVQERIKYSTLHDYELDIAYPDATGPFPAVIFIHGGGWAPLGRAKYRTEIEDYARKGYVALTIDYPGRVNGWREIVKQGPKTVVRWLRANAGTYHVDTLRIGATGGSAGAHLAAMLATTADDPSLAPVELSGYSDKIDAAFLFSGSYDMTYNWTHTADPSYVRPILEIVFGGAAGATPSIAPSEYAQGSPVTHVTADDAPFYICHGTADTTSPYQQVGLMEAALTSAGVSVDTLVIEGAPHNWDGTEYAAVGRAKMDEFFDRVLGP